MTDQSPPDMAKVLLTGQDIMRNAGHIAMRHFRKAIDIEVKSDESPVTLADKAIESAARDQLAQSFPDHAILGEEFGTGDLKVAHVWVIDPIDGTRSFIAGHPLFGVLLGFVEEGEPLLGMIYMPALNELYIGQQGTGATLNGQPVEVSSKTDLTDAIIFINEGEKLMSAQPDLLSRLLRAGHTRRLGYDCYAYALLAAGHVDAVVDFDLKPFDFLPLIGVVEAAGGVITDWEGRPLNFESDGTIIAACSAELHAQLLALVSGEEKG